MCDPSKIFLKNLALSLLYPSGALASCTKLEKTNGLSVTDIFKDRRRDYQTDRGDYIGPPRTDLGPM